MLNKGIFLTVCTCVCGLMISATLYADSVKLKNGSYFEGRVLEEAAEGVTMKLKVGQVFFKADEIAELVYAEEEENLMIESRWAPSDGTQIELSKEEADRELLDDYLHQGKVRYQGRWITQEAHDVIQREKDIKQKRLRFLKDKEKKERARKIEEEKIAVRRAQSEGGRTGAPVSLDNRLSSLRGRTFGNTHTKTFATTESTKFDGRLGETKSFGDNESSRGSTGTKKFATVDNEYAGT